MYERNYVNRFINYFSFFSFLEAVNGIISLLLSYASGKVFSRCRIQDWRSRKDDLDQELLRRNKKLINPEIIHEIIVLLYNEMT